MINTRDGLNGAVADGAREVEVAPDGSVREVPQGDPPEPQLTTAKPTRLSPHTFGARRRREAGTEWSCNRGRRGAR